VSEQLLTLFKFGLLAVLYVFFLRVLWAVWSEIKSAAIPANAAGAAAAPKAAAAGAGFSAAVGGAVATRSPTPSASAPAAPNPVASGPDPLEPLPDPLADFAGFKTGAQASGPGAGAPGAAGAHGSGTPASGAHSTVPTRLGRLIVREPAEAAGTNYNLDNEITVGRAAGCGICIDDTFVSQLHARVFRSASGYFLEDLGSTNGTFHNTHRLTAQQPQPLEPGDYIQFGSTVLEFA